MHYISGRRFNKKFNGFYLFGSRTDDNKKGGDIDLLLKPGDKINDVGLFDKKISFIIKLKQNIGDRKIDVLIDIGQKSKTDFFNEIYKHGILL